MAQESTDKNNDINLATNLIQDADNSKQVQNLIHTQKQVVERLVIQTQETVNTVLQELMYKNNNYTGNFVITTVYS